MKPANVYLCKQGGVKLLDFGLAISLTEVDGSRLTSLGTPVGTPNYMAIEQAMGLHDEDARTDVWGLGATLYRAVAGRPPFDAPSAMAQLARVVNDDPDPLPGDVPPWLASILLRSLDKDKGSRFASIGEMAAALREGLEEWQQSDTVITGPADLPVELGDEVRIVSVPCVSPELSAPPRTMARHDTASTSAEATSTAYRRA